MKNRNGPGPVVLNEFSETTLNGNNQVGTRNGPGSDVCERTLRRNYCYCIHHRRSRLKKNSSYFEYK